MFDPSSFVISGGGEKGRSLPDNAYEMVLNWTGVPRVEEGYGMSELMGINAKCSAGNFHINPWLVPFVLDVDALEPLPSVGRTTGRFAGIDLLSGDARLAVSFGFSGWPSPLTFEDVVRF